MPGTDDVDTRVRSDQTRELHIIDEDGELQGNIRRLMVIGPPDESW
jgi:hypothetical protein